MAHDEHVPPNTVGSSHGMAWVANVARIRNHPTRSGGGGDSEFLQVSEDPASVCVENHGNTFSADIRRISTGYSGNAVALTCWPYSNPFENPTKSVIPV